MGVPRHYHQPGLEQRIVDALRAAGKDPERLEPKDLAPIEEFHTLGRHATVELAQAAEIASSDKVLDAGSGIGGPARVLANRFGAHVTGVDFTPEYCKVAESLSRRSGLSDRTRFVCADALDLPFDEGSFEVVWTQHVAMNVADKAAFYRELRRVTRTGGRLAFFDVVAGAVQPIHFPVPWAAEPGISFLEPAEAVRAHVEAAGFRPRLWDDVTERAIEFYSDMADEPPAEPDELGLHLLIPNIVEASANLVRNVEEDRIRLISAVCDAV